MDTFNCIKKIKPSNELQSMPWSRISLLTKFATKPATWGSVQQLIIIGNQLIPLTQLNNNI